MSTKQVLFVVAHEGYQPVEYDVPKKLLEQAGINVITASDKAGIATAKDDSTTPVDVLLAEADMASYDGLFFIGGPGALEHLDNQESYKKIQAMAAAKKPLGAICIATRILAAAGVLNKRQATGWDGDGALNDLYQQHNVYYAQQDVVVDDTIITATGPSAAREFGERIITLLQD